MVEKSYFFLFGIVFGTLVFCSVMSLFLKYVSRATFEKHNEQALFSSRVKAWWLLALFLCLAVWSGPLGLLVFFALLSFQCLREYMSMIKTKISDHHALIWSFYFFLPFNYFCLGMLWGILFTLLIPVGAFLFLPMVAVLRKDTTQFLMRTAQIQWGLMVCVYFLSYIPALFLSAFYVAPTDYYEISHRNVALLVFFFLTVQAGNVCEYIWTMLQTHVKLFPDILPKGKTIEGLIAGFLGAQLFGLLLHNLTSLPYWQVLFIVSVTFFAGFFGRVVLMAIKQSKGMDNWSYRHDSVSSVGMLDLVDSLCFAAPVFFCTYHFLRSV